ncbi:methyltransferase domain-containing protein [Corallococcus sp. CA047B]|uniref:class I SAM-dependent methyltransferase n=1 Tax=Corallococcus sp. CA047B TaxID=2316729 RepID=UPI000EA3235A|nr:methyltransferase domain-containing protein [Corallococcus sp. CA047B]RKH10548.1 methyltransferase domain-containing protein [Corallococcus sp. CA047B]
MNLLRRSSDAVAPRLLSPDTGRPLSPRTPATPDLWTDGTGHWPVVEGIPFLRTGRDALRDAVVQALEQGDRRHAVALLLRDQDDHARTPPPSLDEAAAVVAGVEDGTMGLREAMDRLCFGPVAAYFAHRQSAPTFLSALGLLAQHWDAPPRVVEVACGIGQVLREVTLRGTPGVGLDVVFARLWLARHFIVPDALLVCVDVAASGLPLSCVEGATVLCHDAFYFLPDKEGVLLEMRRVAGDTGRVLVGHAHNRRVDQRGVGGTPLSPEEYARLLPQAACYDDAAFVTGFLEQRPVPAATPEELRHAEALCFAWPADPARRAIDFGAPAPDVRLRPNPLLTTRDGLLSPAWPTPGLALEYANAHYLRGDSADDTAFFTRATRGAMPDERPVLLRRRWLLDLPERW